MGDGDTYSLINHGVYNLSGTAIAAAVGRVVITPLQRLSGSDIHIVSMGNGQAAVLEVNVAL